MLILYFLLGVTLIGTLTSTIFLFLTMAGVIRFWSDARQLKATTPTDADFPPASLLKPVHGSEAQLHENIESFFRQDYPCFEILFAADEEDDAALQVVREVRARYPKVPDP